MKYIIPLLLICLIGCVSNLNQQGFDIKKKTHSITNTYYSPDGYDIDGFNKDGLDKNGYNRFGFDKNGYNQSGFDKEGYDPDGYNKLGFDKYGYNKNGYNQYGFDKEGYDPNGYNKLGFNKYGFNVDGYNSKGYDKHGFASNGFNEAGFGKMGYDKNGFNVDGIHKITKTRYDVSGYDVNGQINIHKYKKSKTDDVSGIMKSIKKLESKPKKGDFETTAQYNDRLKEYDSEISNQKEIFYNKLFVFNFPLSSSKKRDDIICKYSADHQRYHIQMQNILTVFEEREKIGSYVGKNAYGSEYRVQKETHVKEMLFLSNIKNSSWSSSYSHDPYVLDLHIPIKINIAKKSKLNAQLLYKINKEIPPHFDYMHLSPKIDFLYDMKCLETGIYIKPEAIVIYDQNKNMIHYEKIY